MTQEYVVDTIYFKCATSTILDCPMGCKQCKNPVCKPKLVLILYHLGFAEPQFRPMLYDFEGEF